MIIWKKFTKLCHVSFFKFDKKKCEISKKQKTSPAAFEKNAWCDVFGFLIIFNILIKLEKTNKRPTFQGFFRKP